MSQTKSLGSSILKRFNSVVIFFTLLILLVVVYRNFVFDVPRRDAFDFTKNLRMGSSSFTYWLETLSYSRTRIVGVGDYFLFRPALHGYLGAREIFLTSRPLARGLLSLLISALSLTLLYKLVSQLAGRYLGAILILLLTFHVPGLELFAWSHISGYGLMVGLLAATFYLYLYHNTSIIALSVLLLSAMAFHDVLSWVFLPAILVSYGLTRIGGARPDCRLLRASTISSLMFAFVNVVDYVFRRGISSPLGPADSIPRRGEIGSITFAVIEFTGAIAGSTYFGFASTVGIINDQPLTSWEYTDQVWIWSIGLAGIGGLGVLLCVTLRKDFTPDRIKVWIVGCSSFGVAIGASIVIALGRAGTRTSLYLESSLYYTSLISMIWLISLACGVSLVPHSQSTKRLLSTAIAALVIVQVPAHQKALSMIEGSWKESSRYDIQVEYSKLVDASLQHREYRKSILNRSGAVQLVASGCKYQDPELDSSSVLEVLRLRANSLSNDQWIAEEVARDVKRLSRSPRLNLVCDYSRATSTGNWADIADFIGRYVSGPEQDELDSVSRSIESGSLPLSRLDDVIREQERVFFGLQRP